MAERVPTRDWSFIDPEGLETYPEKSPGKNNGGRGGQGFLQKSEETSLQGFLQKSGETSRNLGGRPKQAVAISANGMKHLLAHVPNQAIKKVCTICVPLAKPSPGATG